MNKIITWVLFILILLIMFFSLRGLPGNPSAMDLNLSEWKENGPFELSPERGRFALLYSIVENSSFQFSSEIGEFARPDVAVSKGKYVSMFAPLLSFVVAPGYIIGKYFNVAQVGAFAVIAIFAIFNFFLIRAIAINLGSHKIAASLGALTFLLATPAFAYGVNLYQHHISTFLILMSIYFLIRFNNAWSLFLVFFLCALAIPLDYPNLFFLFPIGVYALGRTFVVRHRSSILNIQLNLRRVLTVFAIVLPILFFLWFNYASFGDPFQLSGTLPSAKKVPLTTIQNSNTSLESGVKPSVEVTGAKNAISFFKTRQTLNGFYIQFLSPDRGIIFYTPVILLGVLGAFVAYRRKLKVIQLLLAVIGANILLYSMWGDPWGGWAFGSRYLIPSYAVLSIFIALLLTYWAKNIVFLVVFLMLFSYSTAVNTLGALTSSANPPKAEVLHLEELSGVVQKYTYERNWDYLNSGSSKSFLFRAFGRRYLTAVQYYQILVFVIVTTALGLSILLWIFRDQKE